MLQCPAWALDLDKSIVSKCHGHRDLSSRKIFLALRKIFRFVRANKEYSCISQNLHYLPNFYPF